MKRFLFAIAAAAVLALLPVLAFAQTWNIGPLNVAPGATLNLRTSLPAGTPTYGTCALATGTLPAGVTLDRCWLVVANTAPAGATSTVTFRYTVTPEMRCFPFANPTCARPAYYPYTGFHLNTNLSIAGPWAVWYSWNGQEWIGTYRVLPGGEVSSFVSRSGKAALAAALSAEAEGIRAAADPKAAIEALETKYAVSWNCTGMIGNAGIYGPICREARDFMQANFPKEPPPAPPPPPPADKWVVVNAASTANPPGTVPAYPWANGVRGTTSNGRATQGTACNPAVGRQEGTSYWYGVNGRTDQVARCTKL